MLGAGWTPVVALVAAYVIATLATPAGISGAVLLLPFQVSVLGTPSPAVTPTNLLYNVIATPGGLYRYWRQGQTGGPLAGLLIAGTLPGVIAGSYIRVELLPGPRVFDLVVASVLLPLGIWLALTRPTAAGQAEPRAAGQGGPAAPRSGAHPDRRGRRLRRRDLWHRRRVDSRAAPDRNGPTAFGGRPGRPGVDVRHVGRRRDHVHDPGDPPARNRGTGLANRHRAGTRRPGGRVYGRAHSVPAA